MNTKMKSVTTSRRTRWLSFVLCVFCLSANAAKSHFLDYLIFEGNAPDMLKLSVTHPEAFLALPEANLNAAFDFLFLKYQRDNVRIWVKNLYRAAGCVSSRKEISRLKFCDYFQGLWNGPLRQTFFWDASLVQVSRARELIAGPHKTVKIKRSQCLEASGLLSDVESREGLMAPILEAQVKLFECLDDEAGRVDVYQKLEVLRNIQSAFGT